MDKMTHSKFNLNNFFMAISSALDNTVEKNTYNQNYSSKRVSYIALKIAVSLELDASVVSDIFSYSIIVKNKIASKNLDHIPFNNKNIADNESIKQIINLALEVENNLNIQSNYIVNKDEIIELINNNLTWDETLKQKFIELSNDFSFWLDLTATCQLPFYVFNFLSDFSIEITFTDLLKLTNIISAIVNEYSNQGDSITAIEQKAKVMSQYYMFDEKDENRFIMACSLHKVGLLFIDKEILLKNDALTKSELDIMHSTSYHSNAILQQVFGFDDIAKLVFTFEENLDGSGYPNSLTSKDVSLKQRLISSLYICQALEEKRTYRNSFSIQEIKNILLEDAKNNLLDEAIVVDVINQLYK